MFRVGALSLLLVWVTTSGCRTADAADTSAAASVATPALSAPRPSPSSATARAFYADRFSKKPYMPDVMELGRTLFSDASLSASGKLACASCHDPRFAYGPPDADPKGDGLRAVPSLRYLQSVPRFTEHYFEEAVDESADQGPTGGHTWDGRADTLHDQAKLPLTSPAEMANESVAAVVGKVKQAPYAPRFRELFGADVFDDPTRAETAVLLTLEVFQQSPRDFYPYSSRFDDYLRQRGQLNAAEQRGLALFEDPKKGNCASCHPSQYRRGSAPQLTDFGFAAIGVPRNRALAQNRDPKFFDLGLCGPLRRDLQAHPEYCGLFRAPSLRNVALRKTFFHNGVFTDLTRVVEFYAQRDSNPRKWYGNSAPFDDLPPAARSNVNDEPPFGHKAGQAPALSPSEVKDVVAFLQTLTDADLAH